MTTVLWISTPRLTFTAYVDGDGDLHDTITSGAEVVTPFIGQHLADLLDALDDDVEVRTLDDNDVPTHLRPDACYVCGHGAHPDGEGGHWYWPNKEAVPALAAEAARHDQPGVTEAAYVATHRPY